MSKRALVIGGGGFFGAYNAGVCVTLCKRLGYDYFDTIYGCSSGALAAVMYASNQTHHLENIWRNLVDGKKVINFLNIIRGGQVLNLEYLEDLIKNNGGASIVNKIFSSSVKIKLVVTEIGSGNPRYLSLTKGNIFDLIKASAAVPFIHGPVMVNNKFYIDGGLTDPLPIIPAIHDGHDEIVAILNRPQKPGLSNRQKKVIVGLALRLISKNAYLLFKLEDQIISRIEKNLKDNPFVSAIRPKRSLPIDSFIDTDKERINKTFNIGVRDAKKFLNNYKQSRR